MQKACIIIPRDENEPQAAKEESGFYKGRDAKGSLKPNARV